MRQLVRHINVSARVGSDNNRFEHDVSSCVGGVGVGAVLRCWQKCFGYIW
jgi:hypothetical protein